MDYARFHWRFGRQSGIPACCRVFFIREWPSVWRRVGHASNWARGWGYVPCPHCLKANKRVYVRDGPYAGRVKGSQELKDFVRDMRLFHAQRKVAQACTA